MKGFSVIEPEGTYLVWIDYRATGISENELKDIMIHKAHVAFSMGGSFGIEGKGFFRINAALPKKLLEEALLRFKSNLKIF